MTPEERKERRRETVRRSNEKRKEAKRAWAEANRERLRELGRQRYHENREACLAACADYRARNPEKRRETVRKTNEKRREIRQAWNQMKCFGTVIQKHSCVLCGVTPDDQNHLVVHHEDGCNGNGVPLNNDPDNLVVLCRRCHPKVHSRWGLKRLEEVMQPQ